MPFYYAPHPYVGMLQVCDKHSDNFVPYGEGETKTCWRLSYHDVLDSYDDDERAEFVSLWAHHGTWMEIAYEAVRSMPGYPGDSIEGQEFVCRACWFMQLDDHIPGSSYECHACGLVECYDEDECQEEVESFQWRKY